MEYYGMAFLLLPSVAAPGSPEHPWEAAACRAASSCRGSPRQWEQHCRLLCRAAPARTLLLWGLGSSHGHGPGGGPCSLPGLVSGLSPHGEVSSQQQSPQGQTCSALIRAGRAETQTGPVPWATIRHISGPGLERAPGQGVRVGPGSVPSPARGCEKRAKAPPERLRSDPTMKHLVLLRSCERGV